MISDAIDNRTGHTDKTSDKWHAAKGKGKGRGRGKGKGKGKAKAKAQPKAKAHPKPKAKAPPKPKVNAQAKSQTMKRSCGLKVARSAEASLAAPRVALPTCDVSGALNNVYYCV